LGYIFSVANTTANPRTFDNYAVPLLAIYSRCLYLAYIGRYQDRTNIVDVPYMSSCIYAEIPAVDGPAGPQPREFHLLLGSTYTTGIRQQALSEQRAKMMNLWRRVGVIDPGLQSYQPAKTLPPLPPTLKADIAVGYLKYLNAYLPTDGGATIYIPGAHPPQVAPSTPAVPTAYSDNTIWIPTQAFIMEQFYQIPANVGRLLVALPREDIVHAKARLAPGGPYVSDDILAELRAIVDIRFSPNYRQQLAANIAQINIHLARFITLYFIPHMFAAELPPSTIPKPNLSQPAVIVPTAAVSLLAFGPTMMTRLDHMYSWVNNNDAALKEGGISVPRFGRCAETHPAVALL
jgi:hypothetical protein